MTEVAGAGDGRLRGGEGVRGPLHRGALVRAARHDLTATVVSPGPSRTEFSARGGTDTRGTRFQAPEQVVTTALAALDRRTPPVSLVSGRAHRLIRRLAALLPTRATLRLAESRPATP